MKSWLTVLLFPIAFFMLGVAMADLYLLDHPTQNQSEVK